MYAQGSVPHGVCVGGDASSLRAVRGVLWAKRCLKRLLRVRYIRTELFRHDERDPTHQPHTQSEASSSCCVERAVVSAAIRSAFFDVLLKHAQIGPPATVTGQERAHLMELRGTKVRGDV